MKIERTKNNHINADLSLRSMILKGDIVLLFFLSLNNPQSSFSKVIFEKSECQIRQVLLKMLLSTFKTVKTVWFCGPLAIDELEKEP